MLKSIKEWTSYVEPTCDKAFMDRFNIYTKNFKYYVFFMNEFDNNQKHRWSDPFIEWIEENYPELKPRVDYTGYNSGDGNIIFMFKDASNAMAFKLRWT